MNFSFVKASHSFLWVQDILLVIDSVEKPTSDAIAEFCYQQCKKAFFKKLWYASSRENNEVETVLVSQLHPGTQLKK